MIRSERCCPKDEVTSLRSHCWKFLEEPALEPSSIGPLPRLFPPGPGLMWQNLGAIEFPNGRDRECDLSRPMWVQ